MSSLICPECGAENPLEAGKCSVCQTSLLGVEPVDKLSPQDEMLDDEGLLPQAAEDLSSLLESLKGDDALADFTPSDEDDSLSAPLEIGETESQDVDEDVPDVPEWLNRIRQRAQTEVDSVGEITQKIVAAQDSLEEEKKESQRRQFESLIQKIHGDEDKEPLSEEPPDAEQMDDSREPETEDLDWLTRIRKKHRPAPEGESAEDQQDRSGDSLLQWLVALEDGGEVAEETLEKDSSKPGDLAEETHEVDISAAPGDSTQEIAVGSPKPKKYTAPELSISREEQSGADQFAATVIDEKAPRPVREPERRFSPRLIRLVMALLLIAILSFALFFRGPVNLPNRSQQPQAAAMMDWAEGLPPESSLLIVLDYQAGFSAEIELISTPIFETIFLTEHQVSILSSTPSGALLLNRLLDHAGISDRLDVYDLGYYPVESFSAFGLANLASSNRRLIGRPETIKTLPADPFDGIVILADDYEGAMAWIEQFSSLSPETPIYVLVTAQAGPMLLPYWESGQIKGMVAGIPDAAALDGDTMTLSSRWRAYQMGVVLVMIMLIVSMSFPALQPQRDGRDDRR